MKFKVPKISWHECQAIFSVDIQPSVDGTMRVATAGVDKHVLLWSLNMEYMDDEPDFGDVLKKDSKKTVDNTKPYKFVEFLAVLARHTYPVSIVRWSPSGQLLASGSTDGDVIIWRKSDSTAPDIFGEEDLENKENWLGIITLRGHLEDVADLCWSPDCKCIITGSVDNSIIVWDVEKGRSQAVIRDHRSFVQGVTWDPLDQYLVTMSTDRTCRIYNSKTRQSLAVLNKKPAPQDTDESGKKPRNQNLFHDDSIMGFFRRLTFTPDGELLFCPSGCMETGAKVANATHVFSRHSLVRPAFSLPSEKASLAVRCNPIKYELRGPVKILKQSYRYVYAVACENAVAVYDTQQSTPVAIFKDLHYERLSDLSWSSNGQVLMVSSVDGYCTIIHFSDGELGQPYVPKDVSKATLDNKMDVSQPGKKTDIGAEITGVEKSQSTPVLVE